MPHRSRVLACAVTAAVLTLSACSSAAPPPSGGGPTVITFWSSLRGTQPVVDAFNATHTAIQVDLEVTPTGTGGTNAKLTNATRAGNAPDVATLEYNALPAFALDGAVLDVTDRVDEAFRAALLPQAWDQTTFDGRVYAVPLDIEPMILFYRRDLFEQHGIAVPTTWSEFEQAARDLKAAAPDVRLGTFFTNSAPHLAGFADQAGGQWFSTEGGRWNLDFTDPGTTRVAEYWQRLADEDLVQVAPGNSQQWNAAINNGSVATYIDGAWAAAALMRSAPGGAGKWAAAPLPQWDPAQPRVGVKGGSVFAVTAGSEHPEAAMEFLRWMVTDPEAFRARLSSGASSMYPAAPALVGVADEGFDRSYFGGQDVYALFREQAATVPEGWVWGPRMTATNQLIQEGLARVRYGGTVVEALEQAQEESLPDMRALGLAVAAR
ncbi:carbohydrate ABC transporter substrate-binding protein (CUT1 family) [Pseudonocardia hierapolitana]|uniref:Carbohydrate ABC transporter substrate-binding protein (CUT1 family) n=1 Tax=Pseudonocardia hierapolitana TaxID=1128676 RepID=A0A561ST59_9PSEU|nr:sugar ABC transporter substrate-binding protein [Pseudonocardia hierapolitana]TWF78041.1 carbohydrate ABC transporter substrate-binding protein (CUT1 family) [Pseudonocardia hierapolitana]